MQDLFFGGVDFCVTDNAALEKLITRCRRDPAINGDRRFPFPGPGDNSSQAFELLVDVLRGFYRCVKKFAESISDQFRARILNKISFAGLGNQRQR